MAFSYNPNSSSIDVNANVVYQSLRSYQFFYLLCLWFDTIKKGGSWLFFIFKDIINVSSDLDSTCFIFKLDCFGLQFSVGSS